MLYICTGKINAKAVHAKDPIRLIKSPNFGTTIAPVAVSSTTNVLYVRRLVAVKLDRVGMRL